MDDLTLERYSRQLLVPGFDLEAQERLAASRVLVIGCGGLGSPAAMYLAAMGIGRLTLVDHDLIELSNLPRQIGFTEADVGRLKAEVLAERLRAMSTQIVIAHEPVSFDRSVAEALLPETDLVIDATDNHETRLLIDATTFAAKIPWVMASAVQMAGQIAAFSAQREEGCYHCLAPEPDVSAEGACARLGILGPVVGAVAMEEVLRGIAILTEISPPRWGLIDILDFRFGERRSLHLTKRADCSNCGFTPSS